MMPSLACAAGKGVMLVADASHSHISLMGKGIFKEVLET